MLRVCRRAMLGASAFAAELSKHTQIELKKKKKEKRSDQLPVYEIICSKSSLSNRFQSVGKLAPTFALRQPIHLWDLFPTLSDRWTFFFWTIGR